MQNYINKFCKKYELNNLGKIDIKNFEKIQKNKSTKYIICLATNKKEYEVLLFMNMLSNEKVNFKSLEENIFKEMMKLGREIIQEELRMLDKLILDYRDKEIFVPKDFQPTTIKTKLGEIPIARRRYKMVINGETKWVYLLDELLEINDFGLYSQGIVEMVAREITKKSYRETAKPISEDTNNTISHTAVRNIVLKLGEKIKKIEEEKIKLYEEGKIEGNKESEYIFCEHDGIYVKKQKSKKHKGKKKYKVKHFKKKKGKKKKKRNRTKNSSNT